MCYIGSRVLPLRPARIHSTAAYTLSHINNNNNLINNNNNNNLINKIINKSEEKDELEESMTELNNPSHLFVCVCHNRLSRLAFVCTRCFSGLFLFIFVYFCLFYIIYFILFIFIYFIFIFIYFIFIFIYYIYLFSIL